MVFSGISNFASHRVKAMDINPSLSLEILSHKMFEALASTFPVACASDEFYYFPQVMLPEPNWAVWDRFSAEAVSDIVQRVSIWENELDQLTLYHQSDLGAQIDIALLKNFSLTLREQLSEVRTWKFQPTFYLTLVCIGLAEAMESEDPTAKHERAKGLPDFLDQAARNLDRVPLLFQDLGLKMVSDTRDYLVSLEKTVPGLKSSFPALDRFHNALKKVSTRRDFFLSQKLLEHIFRFHINCDMGIEEINQILDQEIAEMQQILHEDSRALLSDRFVSQGSHEAWQEALEIVPTPVIDKEGLLGLYRGEVQSLTKHCLKKGLVSAGRVSSCPVQVQPMPAYLSAIRIASSYSIPPKNPPTGGTFYIFNTPMSDEAQKMYHREYRMLSAHETYPGHHLLDASRWGLTRLCRRVIEQPIFYEGWACFAEELMRITGYFFTPTDRLLLKKRRLWRAIRGKVDIGLQTGTMDISTAAGYLEKTGISREQAIHSARKYPLNPGYQLCYTLGLRRFLNLFHRYGRDNLSCFAHTIVNQGEIQFSDLEKILKLIMKSSSSPCEGS